MAAASEATSAHDLALLTSEVCFAHASDSLKFGQTISADTETLKKIGFSFGIQKESYTRFGRRYEAILNRATMGNKASGEDAIVLSFGGQVPGCKSMLLSKSSESHINRFSDVITNEKFGWIEPPSSTSTRGNLTKKIFLKRGLNSQPYVMNVMIFNFPDSELRLLTTVNAIPPGVELPEGF
ncbi:MAG: hypothetical protein AAGE37_02830 [Pseudomonadota bacterium]